MERRNQPFVEFLEGLRDDRGALAALRRGLGQPPRTEAGMYRYVVPWLPEDTKPWREAAYYQIAALFACHPAAGGTGNMGNHFARSCEAGGDNTAILGHAACHENIPLRFYGINQYGHPFGHRTIDSSANIRNRNAGIDEFNHICLCPDSTG